MSMDEGLQSTEVSVIKNARAVAKGKVTKGVNSLNILLVQNADESFVYDVIDDATVGDAYALLLTNYDIFQELHERYIDHAGLESDANEKNYAKIVADTFSAINRKYVKFKKSSDKLKVGIQNETKLTTLQKEVLRDRSSLEEEAAAAQQVINATDENLKKTAKVVKTELKRALDSYCSKVREYDAALVSIDKGTESKFTEEKNFSDVIKTVKDTIVKLEAIAIEQPVPSPDNVPVPSTNVDRVSTGVVKLQKISCPKFSGIPRDFAQFKRDFNRLVAVQGRPDVEIGFNLRESIPAKYTHLVQHLDTSQHKEMMSILEDKFGTKDVVVIDIISQVEKMKGITTDKGFIEFVEQLEKIKLDLETLGQISEIANAGYISKIEAKLPIAISTDWWKIVTDEGLGRKGSSERFDRMMSFLKNAKTRVEKQTSSLNQISGSSSQGKSITQFNVVTGAVTLIARQQSSDTTKIKKKDRVWNPCLACNVDGCTDLTAVCHPMDTCVVWNGLSQREKENRSKCLKHPFKSDHSTADCTTSIRKCKICSKETHHFLLCPSRKKSNSNVAKVSSSSTAKGDRVKNPVMLQAQFVSGPDGSRLGALLDLASTDNYITNKYARKHNLHGESILLTVGGIAGTESTIETKVYEVPIMVNGKVYEIPCYGLDVIASVAAPPEKESYAKMCAKYGVKPKQVARPNSIDILISMDDNVIHPKPVKTIGKMILYEGPLGKVFGGQDPELEFTPFVTSYPLSVKPTIRHPSALTMKASVLEATYVSNSKSEKEFLDFFKEEMIGAECKPRCGGCRCGRCATGAKQMSLKDEKDFEHFKSLMYLDKVGTEKDPGPYWVTRFPWIKNKEDLPYNKSAVLGVMNSTRRKLDKEPSWRSIYEKQLLDLLDKGFAREVSDQELSQWVDNGGKTYYIAHQVAVNPTSKSTPVRVVFNSSQKFRGHSLNTSWELGPDMMNSLHGVLMRFRTDYVGAQGDIKKMYYMVRIAKEEQFMQLFLWQFPGDDRIRTFCMCGLVMGNMPSPNLAIVGLNKTVTMDGNEVKHPVAFETITRNCYVDNAFRNGPDLETLVGDIKEIEYVCALGGFYFKEWIISGQDIPEQFISVKLPNQIGVDEERALGVSWDVKNDKFFIKPNLLSPGKKQKKPNFQVELLPTLDGINVKPHLTLRAGLSLHAKSYDPLGLILPTKMIGSILFRETLNDLKKFNSGKIPWDIAIEDPIIKKRWFDYFEMLMQLEKVTFDRCVKPVGAVGDPDLITFNDGNPDAFGVAAYAVYDLTNGDRSAALLMAKAKLGPLTHKGETVKNELCGATLASRMKIWLIQESGLVFKNYFHFLDSMIVKEMLKKSSYGFNTFVGLRVGEIQQKCDYEDWLHIPSQENIADILTKGAPPNMLGPNSIWQKGPYWMVLPSSDWPVTPVLSYEEPSDEMSRQIAQYYRKIGHALVSGCSVDCHWFDTFVSRFSSLQKAVRGMAYLLRFFRWLGRASRFKASMEVKSRSISAAEYNDAFKLLVFLDQQFHYDEKKNQRLATRKVTVKLGTIDISIEMLILSGRVKNFPVEFSKSSEVPVLPCSAFAKLVVQYHHNRHHRDVDTIVTLVRREVWPIKVRKLAVGIDSRCVECKIKRKQLIGQSMGELPSCRSEMLPAFAVVSMDLFGPLEIKDDVVKRGPKTVKKVWGVLYTCVSTRAVHLDIAIDYSTESILHTLRRLMSVRGDIRKIISDPGTQLVSASREMKEWRKGWDEDELVKFGASRNLEWEFVMANSQHQNGISESMVKQVKGVIKSLLRAMGDTKLTLNESFTLFAEVGNLVNERPIGALPSERSGTEYLSPNSLLLGRCSARISAGPFEADKVVTDDPKAVRDRFLLVQTITNQFWKAWIKYYFPTLVIRQKWHVDRRNVRVGDVCLLRDSNAYRGEWRLCKVASVSPDDQGRVRNVSVMVKPRQGGSPHYVPVKPMYLNRHVSNLVLLIPAEDRESSADEQDKNVSQINDAAYSSDTN